MKTVEGDLIALAQTGAFDVIAHGCNCMGSMGKGIAAAIKAAFPAAYEADRATPRGDAAKLGMCSVATCAVAGGASCDVVNAYTQVDHRGRGVKVDYDAVRSCMRWLAARYPGRRIGLPRIGAGLGGGDWTRIADIIEDELAGQDVTLVVLPAP